MMIVTAGAMLAAIGVHAPCRDRRRQPFSSTSIWNTAIGSSAVYAEAAIYRDHGGGTAGTCVAKASRDPSTRKACAGWQKWWNSSDCHAAGCCYDPHPSPDPMGYPWCFSNLTQGPGPQVFYVDIDYFVATSASDPETLFVDQGWWGVDPECGRNHCCRRSKSPLVGRLPFPYSWTVNMTSNNAAAVLLPDGVTLVQFQPLVRCTPGSPLFALPWGFSDPRVGNVSILGDGEWGAHGGSHLSSIGGTIRLGELLPEAPPIPHAIKLMLWAAQYYWPGSLSSPCYRWPAVTCDGTLRHEACRAASFSDRLAHTRVPTGRTTSCARRGAA